MDSRIIIQQQAQKLNQQQLALAALGTHIAKQRIVLEAAKDHLNTLDPNAEGLKARIEELITAQPVEAIDEILRLTGLVHRLTEKVKFMNGIIARHVSPTVNEIGAKVTALGKIGDIPEDIQRALIGEPVEDVPTKPEEPPCQPSS